MKKLIPLLALVVGVSSALAQGIVDFNNNRVYQTTADRLVRDVDMTTPLVGTNYAAQLMYVDATGSLQPAVGVVARFRVTTTGSPGTWSGANRTIPGTGPNGTVMLVVRAWLSSSDLQRGFDEAKASGLPYGESDPFQYTVPAAGSLPSAYYMENLRGFSLVPEPSVIGLGLIGIGALFMLRRRKA